MSVSEALLASLEVAGIAFAFLMLAGLVSLIWRRPDRRPWREQFPLFGRYAGYRLLAAAGIGATFLVITLAALTLNSHRPAADTTPVVRTVGVTGPVTVKLTMADCEEPVSGEVFAPPAVRTGDGNRPAPAFARVYSDADGFQRVGLDRSGRGEFTLSDPSSRRGLLSCWMQLPTIAGNRGASSVKLALPDGMEVDTTASAPNPSGYFSGSWLWDCPVGRTCPSLAAVAYDVEDGVRQLIVLILAAVLGSLIAIFVAEVLIGSVRRRLSERPGGGSDG